MPKSPPDFKLLLNSLREDLKSLYDFLMKRNYTIHTKIGLIFSLSKKLLWRYYLNKPAPLLGIDRGGQSATFANLLQLRKLRCALIFYFETLRCGIKPLKFVAL